MLEVNIVSKTKEEDKIIVGQIRYNDGGVTVLIVGGDSLYDAVALDGSGKFLYNCKNMYGYEMIELFPHIATGKLEITK